MPAGGESGRCRRVLFRRSRGASGSPSALCDDVLQSANELVARLHPLFRILPQQLEHHRSHPIAGSRGRVAGIGGRVVQVRVEDRLRVVTLPRVSEGKMTRENLKQRAAEGVEARAKVAVLAANLLRRRVGGKLGDDRQRDAVRFVGTDFDLAVRPDEDTVGAQDRGAAIRSHRGLGLEFLDKPTRQLRYLQNGERPLGLKELLERGFLGRCHRRLPQSHPRSTDGFIILRPAESPKP